MASKSLTLLVAAFGDPGHAFPAIALARALDRRGHEVLVETWANWGEAVQDEGLAFTPAEAYKPFPPPAADSHEGVSAAEAVRALVPLLEEMRPDAVVSDILTLAPVLAAELAGCRVVTLIPHVYPVQEPGMPFFAIGWMPPKTRLVRGAWRAAMPVLDVGLRRGRDEMNELRAELGLPPQERFHAGISEELALVATFPQLEYPRRWPAHVHVTGPMSFEIPFPDIEMPGGEGPLVLVAPSTSKDPECRLVRVALEALAEEPVRVLATTNRHEPETPIGEVPANTKVVDWVSYSQGMREADLVICHGGHGTVARALEAGVPVLCCPAAGDMTENGARVAWAGAGLMLPWRLTRPGPLRSAVKRLLSEWPFAGRANEIEAWASRHDGATHGANLIEGIVEPQQPT